MKFECSYDILIILWTLAWFVLLYACPRRYLPLATLAWMLVFYVVCVIECLCNSSNNSSSKGKKAEEEAEDIEAQ